MALPKRKHSTQRTGKRTNSKRIKMPSLVKCNKCEKKKLSHRVCAYCASK
ncbi:MAG: 50S ribosomal protein L32 [bacterium]